jgi:LacI family transcriptional regulator
MAIRRGSGVLVVRLRDAIRRGEFAQGEFLPTVRALGARHEVSPEAVRRALKTLEGEGLVQAEPRQGFRVLAEARAGHDHRPVAYVTAYAADLTDSQPVNWVLNRAIGSAAARRGWSSLGVHTGGETGSPVLEQLGAARAWGVVLDTLNRELFELIRGAGLPVVMVNSWVEDAEIDVVLQDNYRGGFLAARHLVEAGARRVAWVGAVEQSCHSRERFAGASAALASCGRSFSPEIVVNVSGEDCGPALRKLLGRANRPDGLIAFGERAHVWIMQAAGALGLTLGEELKVVGWTVEELYEKDFRAGYAGAAVPPAVVWRAERMAEVALDRLEERRSRGGAGPLRICVPTRIRTG